MLENLRVGVISLGCDKNRVDTEKMLAKINTCHKIVNDINIADVIIVNTCAFLESSRKESIEEIFEAVRCKNNGTCKKIIVSGCLPQKFIDEIKDDLPEIDAFMGVSDYDEILSVIDRIFKGERVISVGLPRGECGTERLLTTKGYAYLKIADGCSNHCTYCLIPYIRGKYRSVEMDDLVKEAKNLGQLSELILVAQDTTLYGKDLEPKQSLTGLIKRLSQLENVEKIRLLYCYPETIDDDLIEEIKTNDKVIKYIDVPLQHADGKVLKLMNRKSTGEQYLALIDRLKKEIPGIAIRSTFITGFPYESEEAFENLLEFLKKAKLFNAGFFKYSREKGTPAYLLDGQIDASTKEKRLKKLYSVQKKIVAENNKNFIDKTLSVVAEGFDDEQLVYFGRAYFNAPDIDGKVYFFSSEEVEYGKYYDVKIIKATGYDLYGERL